MPENREIYGLYPENRGNADTGKIYGKTKAGLWLIDVS